METKTKEIDGEEGLGGKQIRLWHHHIPDTSPSSPGFRPPYKTHRLMGSRVAKISDAQDCVLESFISETAFMRRQPGSLGTASILPALQSFNSRRWASWLPVIIFHAITGVKGLIITPGVHGRIRVGGPLDGGMDDAMGNATLEKLTGFRLGSSPQGSREPKTHSPSQL